MEIERPYSEEDVERLRGTVTVEHTLARRGAERLRERLGGEEPVMALGAIIGNQAVQMADAGLKAIYLSGWQVAADANLAGQMYRTRASIPAPDDPAPGPQHQQCLPACRPDSARRGPPRPGDYFLPIVADAEAGFGGPLNAFELMKMMIEAGAAGVHFEDQLASEKKCGHMGGKVLVLTSQFSATLNHLAARLAADVMGVPTLLVARTDAQSCSSAHQRHRRARSPVFDQPAHRGGLFFLG